MKMIITVLAVGGTPVAPASGDRQARRPVVPMIRGARLG
ncbi:hypothetical protein FHR33_007588 [Nonomuraea dietziae]|uniref:Uncharacterized protein n=1 Tax=Nonomuraea dietziae TaxID=65515 RepID=A0A7W5VGP6_9ACTN|nr:hypothetical protein [Nonomuraea dietziae]